MNKGLDHRPKWKAEQLDYDVTVIGDSDDYCLYCLNSTQAQALIALVSLYGWKTRFYSQIGTEIDPILTAEWRDDLTGRLLMSECCGGENPPARYRFVDNVYQRSTDEGVTWVNAPEYDYRNISTIFADPADVGVSYTKCQAADSVVHKFDADIVQAWEEDMTASGILAVVAAVALAFLTAGTSLAVTAVAVGVGAAVVAAGVAAAQAAFTEDVWDEFRCMIFNNMNTDSSISALGVDALYIELDSFVGVVAPTLKGMVAAMGSVGLTNIMRELGGDPDADCTECNDFCPVDWVANQGTIISTGDDFIEVEAVNEFGGYYATLTSPALDPENCCQVTDFIVTSGVIDDIACLWRNCGEMTDSTGLYAGQECYVILRHSTAPFTVKFVFA